MWDLETMCVLHNRELARRKPRKVRKGRKRKTAKGKTSPAAELPRQELLASIDVYEHALVLTRWGKAKDVRYVDPIDVVEIFREAGMAGATRYVPAWPDTLATGFDANGEVHAVAIRRRGKATIRCEIGSRNRRFRLLLPNLVFELSGQLTDAGAVRWKRVQKVMAYASRTVRPTADTPLYAAPLPNCYETGRVCMGSVSLDHDEWEGLTPALVFEHGFIKTLFTDHLGGGLSGYRNIFDAYRKTKGRVPLQALQRLGTAGEMLKGVV